jgi:uncharacterized protein (TIGR02588 family)
MKVPEKNGLEWAVFAASLALIAAVVGALIQFEISRPDTPPELHVRTAGIRPSGDGYAVVVEVENRGGETASNATIEVELSRPGAPAERSEVHLPFVPHGAVRTGEAVFTTDPATGTLRARVVGYERP